MRTFAIALGAVLMLSFVASADGPAADPTTAKRVESLKAGVDHFKLIVRYYGPEDKPFYRLTLGVWEPYARAHDARPDPFGPVVKISKAQALKIIAHLEQGGVIGKAKDYSRIDGGPDFPQLDGPCYALRMQVDGVDLLCDLGWGAGMLKDLDGLSKVLDGDSVNGMDRLLARLSGYRKEWETGERAAPADAKDEEKPKAERIQKLKTAESFILFLRCEGPVGKNVIKTLAITCRSTHAGELMVDMESAVGKEEVPKIVDWLDKDGFFEQAQTARDRELAHPSCILEIMGGGARLNEDIGWGAPLAKRLAALQTIVNPAAAKAIGTFLAAAKDEAKGAAAERAAKLKADLGSFSITLQYMGGFDPKAPRWSFTLSTKAVPRLAMPAAHSDVVIDEKQALKIIEELETDGFFERAAEGYKRAQLTTAGYDLLVSGNGQLLSEYLGWSAMTFTRIDSLASALEGDSAKAMQKVLDGVAGERAKMEVAERVRKCKENVDKFTLSLAYQGPPTKKTPYWMTISTHAIEYAARAEGGLDAVVTKDEALRIIDRLAEDGFFKNAETKTRTPPDGPCYVLSLRSEDAIWESLGWGDALMGRLDSLRTVLNPDAAEKLGKLMARAKELASEPAAVGPKIERDPAKRAAALKADVDHLIIVLRHIDAKNNPAYELTLSTQRINRARSAAYQHSVFIDKETALKLVDRLDQMGVLRRAWDANDREQDKQRRAPEGPCCTVNVNGAGMRLVDDLGWGDPLAGQLKGIRALLAGDAATEMDKLLESAKDATAPAADRREK